MPKYNAGTSAPKLPQSKVKKLFQATDNGNPKSPFVQDVVEETKSNNII